jgi:hypothetical protein
MSFKVPSSIKPIVYCTTVENDGQWQTVANTDSPTNANQIIQIDSIKINHTYSSGVHTLQLRANLGGTATVFLDQHLFNDNTLIALQAETPIYLNGGDYLEMRLFDESGYTGTPYSELANVIMTGWEILK